MPIRTITADAAAAWLAGLPERGSAVVYKHSPTCHVSARVIHDVARFAWEFPDVPVYLVDVVNQQPMSHDLADTLGVAHVSPQVIWIEDRAPAWITAYYEIRAERLREQALARGHTANPPATGSPDDLLTAVSGRGAWWIKLALAPPIVRRSLGFALIIGGVLIAIDQGPAIVRGEFGPDRLGRVALMLILPYLATTVATIVAAWRLRPLAGRVVPR